MAGQFSGRRRERRRRGICVATRPKKIPSSVRSDIFRHAAPDGALSFVGGGLQIYRAYGAGAIRQRALQTGRPTVLETQTNWFLRFRPGGDRCGSD